VSYVEQNLITDEHVVYRARPHWASLGGFLTATLLFAIAGLASVAVAILMWDDRRTDGAVPLGLVLLAAAVVVFGIGKVVRATSEFAVTNKRVIAKTGLLHKHTAEMFLAKIESVGVDQGLTARVLGYGTITIRGTGGSLEPFIKISDPLEFRRHVQEQIAAIEERRLVAR